MMKKCIKVGIVFFILVLLGCIALFIWYQKSLSAPTKTSEEITFEVKENSTYLGLAQTLKEQGLIRSINSYKIYIKFIKPQNLQKGTYVLNKNMGVKKIIETLENGTYNSVSITLREGIDIVKIADLISINTSNSAEDVYALLQDETYLDELIQQYWFITDKIKDPNIYYSLEGYFYPDTYLFDKDTNVKSIFKVMLDQMSKKIEPYKEQIQNSSYSFHEILTIASIAELEAAYEIDRANITSVIYNRLKNNMNLGVDPTAFYGARVAMGTRDLKQSELDADNPYNTRNLNFKQLPIGPICMPSISSIEAALNPNETDYLYFVADKNHKVYFTKTFSEHNAMIQKLKQEGLWYIWN